MISRKLRVRPVHNKGLGVVAVEDIEAGELLIKEDPLLLLTDWSPSHLTTAWNRLSPASQAKYLLLANSHQDTNPLLGIALTNMIPVNKEGSMFAVFETVSRVNHSCKANCNHYQERTAASSLSHTECVRAVLDIKEGEEITICYRFDHLRRSIFFPDFRNPMEEGFITREERRQLLKENFGFKCACPLCSSCLDQVKENDELRLRVLRMKHHLLELLGSSGLTTCPDLMLRESILWSSLITAAGYHQDFQLDAIFLCYSAASALNNQKASKHWANLGAKTARITRGEQSRNARYFLDCLK